MGDTLPTERKDQRDEADVFVQVRSTGRLAICVARIHANCSVCFTGLVRGFCFLLVLWVNQRDLKDPNLRIQ